jgi:hypothetical protein
MLEKIQFILENGPEIVGAIVLLLMGVSAVAAWIPGDQPEKTVNKIVAFLSKFSRKPKAD